MGSYEEPLTNDFQAEQFNLEAATRITPCYFPFLTDGVIVEQVKSRSGNFSHRETLTIDLEHNVNAHALRAFSNKHNVDLPSLFHLSWSVVLASYIGTQNVTFIKVKAQKDKREVGVCNFEFEGEVTTLEALKQLEGNFTKECFPRDKRLKVPVTVEGGQALNSIVVFRDSYEESSKSDVSGGFVEVCF